MTTPDSDSGGGSGGLGKSWVQFDEEDTTNQQTPARDGAAPAVIDAQSVQVSLENHHSKPSSPEHPPAPITRTTSEPANGVRLPPPSTTTGEARVTMSPLSPSQLHNVPLHDPNITRPTPPLTTTTTTTTPSSHAPVIRQGFTNGDVIVTLLPQNTSLPWITPAQFRPELVPEELMAHGLTLTVEDYVHIMSQLVNDYRFTLYNVCYKRILMAWIILGFVILLCVLFSGLSQLALFGAGIGWLLVNAAAIFFCMWVKIRLNKALEQCMAEINLQLLRHKILLGLDDRGKLSCHKVNLCFIYFDTHECVAKLQELIEEEERAGRSVGRGEGGAAAEAAKIPSLSQRLDIDDSDIIVTGTTNTRISRQQERAQLLLGRYSQRWAKDFLRKRLDWAFDAAARLEGLSPPPAPRHLPSARCPCQYVEEHLRHKFSRNQHQSTARGPCACLTQFCQDAEF
ncbi:hypothetical protein Pcinc_016481 [Petrolisthes cinctipes]|uniref:Transmembrane protein 268 n=1 Tax=Petrolisthes cinctipes TaxID=88211 RepID=A0AAE1FST0_PETCI|nr:hypothetical protein Pcinc_016481 [Petrolisthes cinctipes]